MINKLNCGQRHTKIKQNIIISQKSYFANYNNKNDDHQIFKKRCVNYGLFLKKQIISAAKIKDNKTDKKLKNVINSIQKQINNANLTNNHINAYKQEIYNLVHNNDQNSQIIEDFIFCCILLAKHKTTSATKINGLFSPNQTSQLKYFHNDDSILYHNNELRLLNTETDAAPKMSRYELQLLLIDILDENALHELAVTISSMSVIPIKLKNIFINAVALGKFGTNEKTTFLLVKIFSKLGVMDIQANQQITKVIKADTFNIMNLLNDKNNTMNFMNDLIKICGPANVILQHTESQEALKEKFIRIIEAGQVHQDEDIAFTLINDFGKIINKDQQRRSLFILKNFDKTRYISFIQKFFNTSTNLSPDIQKEFIRFTLSTFPGNKNVLTALAKNISEITITDAHLQQYIIGTIYDSKFAGNTDALKFLAKIIGKMLSIDATTQRLLAKAILAKEFGTNKDVCVNLLKSLQSVITDPNIRQDICSYIFYSGVLFNNFTTDQNGNKYHVIDSETATALIGLLQSWGKKNYNNFQQQNNQYYYYPNGCPKPQNNNYQRSDYYKQNNNYQKIGINDNSLYEAVQNCSTKLQFIENLEKYIMEQVNNFLDKNIEPTNMEIIGITKKLKDDPSFKQIWGDNIDSFWVYIKMIAPDKKHINMLHPDKLIGQCESFRSIAAQVFSVITITPDKLKDKAFCTKANQDLRDLFKIC